MLHGKSVQQSRSHPAAVATADEVAEVTQIQERAQPIRDAEPGRHFSGSSHRPFGQTSAPNKLGRWRPACRLARRRQSVQERRRGSRQQEFNGKRIVRKSWLGSGSQQVSSVSFGRGRPVWSCEQMWSWTVVSSNCRFFEAEQASCCECKNNMVIGEWPSWHSSTSIVDLGRGFRDCNVRVSDCEPELNFSAALCNGPPVSNPRWKLESASPTRETCR